VILRNLGKGFQEGMLYGMIGYYVPLDLYPSGYCGNADNPLPFCNLASQKNHCALYLCLHQEEQELQWFQQEWAKTGKKLDMGKSCVRFKKIEDLPLPLIGKAIKRYSVKKFVAQYEACQSKAAGSRRKR